MLTPPRHHAPRPLGLALALGTALALLGSACGTTAGPEDNEGSDSTEAPGTADTHGGSGPSTSPEGTGSTTAPPGDETPQTTDQPALDAPTPDPPDHGPGEPPETCTLPATSNASLVGRDSVGPVMMEAAAFARSGGALCRYRYQVLFASDIDALTALSTTYDPAGVTVAVEHVELDFDLPADGLGPGVWEGYGVHRTPGGAEAFSMAVAEITEVTRLDVAEPRVVGTVEVFELSETGEPRPTPVLAGAFDVPYCADLEGLGCAE